ncbi:MAG TPA: hypothetical protein VNA26_02890 [Chitinophagaceae bacterium]|nr:hypothetical protein [Chitinophagaceae bacterium]
MRKNESIMFVRSISYYYIKGIYSYQTEKLIVWHWRMNIINWFNFSTTGGVNCTSES